MRWHYYNHSHSHCFLSQYRNKLVKYLTVVITYVNFLLTQTGDIKKIGTTKRWKVAETFFGLQRFPRSESVGCCTVLGAPHLALWFAKKVSLRFKINTNINVGDLSLLFHSHTENWTPGQGHKFPPTYPHRVGIVYIIMCETTSTSYYKIMQHVGYSALNWQKPSGKEHPRILEVQLWLPKH